MSKVNHILIATDGSELAKKAAAYAGDMARALEARITVVMVHDEQTVIPEAWSAAGIDLRGGTLTSTEDIRKQIEEHALINELAETASMLGDLSAKPDLVNLWGHTSDQICDYAGTHAIDLIVIGSHGRSGIREALLGSVSHSVANRAPCAVTIVR